MVGRSVMMERVNKEDRRRGRKSVKVIPHSYAHHFFKQGHGAIFSKVPGNTTC